MWSRCGKPGLSCTWGCVLITQHSKMFKLGFVAGGSKEKFRILHWATDRFLKDNNDKTARELYDMLRVEINKEIREDNFAKNIY